MMVCPSLLVFSHSRVAWIGSNVRAAYGPNYEPLTRVKRRYDQENLFRMNQNIAPA